MTLVSATRVEAEGSPFDRLCASCGRSFTVGAHLGRHALDELARVNGWHIGPDATLCPGCRGARLSLSGR
jgi:hypothetical protein